MFCVSELKQGDFDFPGFSEPFSVQGLTVELHHGHLHHQFQKPSLQVAEEALLAQVNILNILQILLICEPDVAHQADIVEGVVSGFGAPDQIRQIKFFNLLLHRLF